MRIATDWEKNRPTEVWRHDVGPGWSSFAVIGKRLYTQEQRGDLETVVCYDADTGKELWAHTDQAKFTETMGGPGPRATPTFHDGKIYALGATGLLNCLDAGSGKLYWMKDVKDASRGKTPMWAFAGSPLVLHGLVIAFAAGPEKSKEGQLVAYDAATGELKWTQKTGKLSYCSPQLAKLYGVEQVLFTSDLGVTSVNPINGDLLWQDDWSTTEKGIVRIVQPAVVDDADVLLGTGMGTGTQRFHVLKEGDAWKTEEKWTSTKICPYFSDFVVHEDHIYGFDNKLFTCVKLKDGQTAWRARGYEYAQSAAPGRPETDPRSRRVGQAGADRGEAAEMHRDFLVSGPRRKNLESPRHCSWQALHPQQQGSGLLPADRTAAGQAGNQHKSRVGLRAYLKTSRRGVRYSEPRGFPDLNPHLNLALLRNAPNHTRRHSRNDSPILSHLPCPQS